LDQISNHINEIRTSQEARLDVLTLDEGRVNYEELARKELRAGRLDSHGVGSAMNHDSSSVMVLHNEGR